MMGKLTATKINSLKAKEKAYRVGDGNNLRLLIKPNGVKLWEFKYKSPVTQKVRLTSFGVYPSTELATARKKALQYTQLIAESIDPVELKHKEKSQKQKETVLSEKGQFHKVFYRWIQTKSDNGNLSQKQFIRITRTFERDVFPYFVEYELKGGNKTIKQSTPIKEITKDEVFKCVQDKQLQSVETGARILNDCVKLWDYAIHEQLAPLNVARLIDKETFVIKVHNKPLAKIADEQQLKKLYNAIDSYKGNVSVKLMLKLYCYLPLRPQNMTSLKWEFINFDEAVLTIPRDQMKISDTKYLDFTLPLPHQAIEIFKELKQLNNWSEYIFPSPVHLTSPINKETANRALRDNLKFNGIDKPKQTQHSFRGTYSSLCESYSHEHGVSFEAKEAVLDHHPLSKDKASESYSHLANYKDQMKKIMQWWADKVDEIKNN